MFTQTLSDLTLDWSKVRSDKLLCVNTAIEGGPRYKPPEVSRGSPALHCSLNISVL